MAEDRKLGATGVVLGAFGGCALILVIGVVFLYFAIVKTGLTSKSIDVPQPTRVVDADSKTSDTIKTDIVASVLRSLSNGEAQIVISEEMLTSMIRTDLNNVGEQEGLDFRSAQVVIIDEQLEIYIPLEQGDKKTALTMLVKPVLYDGGITMELTEARLGNLKAPKFLTEIPENMINDAIKNQLDKVEDSFELIALKFDDGSFTLTGKVSLDSIPGF